MLASRFTLIIMFGWLLAFVVIKEKDPEALKKQIIWIALSMVFWGSVSILIEAFFV